MNSRPFAIVLGLALLASHARPIVAQGKPAAGPPAPPAVRVAFTIRTPLDARRTLGTPKAFRNLTLIPVYNPIARATDTYMTLDEGLKAKVVKVREAKGGGEVNTLYISNLGRKPLYVMAGEVVLGGQQDRCLGRDTIIPPRKKETPIAVFCVEHGRWTGHGDFDDSAKMVASAGIRASAQNGAFAAEAPADSAPAAIGGRPASPALNAQRAARRSNDTDGARQIAQARRVSEAQQQVWDKVAAKNKRFNAETETGTYRGVLNMAGGDAQKSVAPYLKAFSGGLDRDPQLVGVLAAVNGKVVAADIFGDPSLFRRLWPKLLRSYAADAAENAPAKGHKTSVVTATMGKSFFVTAKSAKTKAANKSDVSTTLRLESKDTTLYSLQVDGHSRAGGGRAFGGGGMGGALHENALRK